eukprot:scaffold5055_cov129-Isochrysis_galbana.AAC.1
MERSAKEQRPASLPTSDQGPLAGIRIHVNPGYCETEHNGHTSSFQSLGAPDAGTNCDGN